MLYVELFILPLEEFFATLGDLGDINLSAPHLVCVDVDDPAFTSGRNGCNIEVEDLELGNASGIIFDNSCLEIHLSSWRVHRGGWYAIDQRSAESPHDGRLTNASESESPKPARVRP